MQMNPEQTVKVFYCYAHEDEQLCDQLEKHLKSLNRIIGWHDRKISAGKSVSDEIDAQLNTADIILLLISPDFIASEYCYGTEMRQALKLHDAGTARVIPVMLRPVFWETTPFSSLKVLPKDGKPVTLWANHDTAFVDIASGLRAYPNNHRH